MKPFNFIDEDLVYRIYQLTDNDNVLLDQLITHCTDKYGAGVLHMIAKELTSDVVQSIFFTPHAAVEGKPFDYVDPFILQVLNSFTKIVPIEDPT